MKKENGEKMPSTRGNENNNKTNRTAERQMASLTTKKAKREKEQDSSQWGTVQYSPAVSST